MITSHAPHWLPLPGKRLMRGAEMEPPVSDNDLFPKGSVVRYYPQQGHGVVRTAQQEELPFRLTEIDLVGAKGDKKFLREGARVGYDVAWTSKGLHIRLLKIY